MAENKDAEIKSELKKVDWGKLLDYGSVKVQVKHGKPVLTHIEITVKID